MGRPYCLFFHQIRAFNQKSAAEKARTESTPWPEHDRWEVIKQPGHPQGWFGDVFSLTN